MSWTETNAFFFSQDLGKRLLPVFNTATGMPYRFVNLQTGKIRDSLNNPAEIGTSLLEFGNAEQANGQPGFTIGKRKTHSLHCTVVVHR